MTHIKAGDRIEVVADSIFRAAAGTVTEVVEFESGAASVYVWLEGGLDVYRFRPDELLVTPSHTI